MSLKKEWNTTEIGDNGIELCEDKATGDFPFASDELALFRDVRNDQLPGEELTNNISMGAESRDNAEGAKDEKMAQVAVVKCDPSVYIDEETRMFCNQSPEINSPRDIVSPTDPGEVSSPFSAMESDGMETGFDDASLSAPGDAGQRPMVFYGASTPLEYTTTPGASSSGCNDNYESSGSRKKRRKTRRDMQPAYHTPRSNQLLLRFPPAGSQTATSRDAWCHDADSSPFSPPQALQKGSPNFNFAEFSSRRSSGGAGANEAQLNQNSGSEFSAEQAKRSRTCVDVDNDEDTLKMPSENSNTFENPVSITTTPCTANANRRRFTHHRAATTTTVDSDSILNKQFPRKTEQIELRIISQPETQHRARYLTEGSRGPVKDASQQGYPKVQLVGYTSPTVLQVFVATDSGKVKPHGFYQACRVTGRNTSPCEEREIEGTKVIEIPFKSEDMILSIDCVGILKLRNTDVEARMGVRNQKRNQSVRLVFRVCLDKVPNQDVSNPLILQVASVRISCTQPLGQPEITKKSIDRCSVIGGTEMFIIGKNFHRGTKVIYQDPEDPNETQWSQEGEVDKDTFHQTHMVVRVPPYHDQSIIKPVNVQLLVEYQGKKCEPHSFTYMPVKKEPIVPKEESVSSSATIPTTTEDSSASAMQSLLEGPIDKKFLVALFSKLFSSVGPDAKGDTQPAEQTGQNGVPLRGAATTNTLTGKLLMEAALSDKNLLAHNEAVSQAPNILQVAGSCGAANLKAASFAYVSGSQIPNPASNSSTSPYTPALSTSNILINGANPGVTNTIPFVAVQTMNTTVPVVQPGEKIQNDVQNTSVSVNLPAVKIESEILKQSEFVWAESADKTMSSMQGTQPALTIQQATPLFVQSDQLHQTPNSTAAPEQPSMQAQIISPSGFQEHLAQGNILYYNPISVSPSGFTLQQIAVNTLPKPAVSQVEKVIGTVNAPQTNSQSNFGNQVFNPGNENVPEGIYADATQAFKAASKAHTTLVQSEYSAAEPLHGSVQYHQHGNNQQGSFVSAAVSTQQPFLPLGTSCPSKPLQSLPGVNTNVVTTIVGTLMTTTFQYSNQDNLFQLGGNGTSLSSTLAFENPFDIKNPEQFGKLQETSTHNNTGVGMLNFSQTKPQGMDQQSQGPSGQTISLLQQQQPTVLPVQMFSEIVEHHNSSPQLERPAETPMQVDPYHCQQTVDISNMQQGQVNVPTSNLSPLGQIGLTSNVQANQAMRNVQQHVNSQLEGMQVGGVLTQQVTIAPQAYHSQEICQQQANSQMEDTNTGVQQPQNSLMSTHVPQSQGNDQPGGMQQPQAVQMPAQVFRSHVNEQDGASQQAQAGSLPGQVYQLRGNDPADGGLQQAHNSSISSGPHTYQSPGKQVDNSQQAHGVSMPAQAYQLTVNVSTGGHMQQAQGGMMATQAYPPGNEQPSGMQQAAQMSTDVYRQPENDQAGGMQQTQNVPASVQVQVYRSVGNEQDSGLQQSAPMTTDVYLSSSGNQGNGMQQVQGNQMPAQATVYHSPGNGQTGVMQQTQVGPMSTQAYQSPGGDQGIMQQPAPMSTELYPSPGNNQASGMQQTQTGPISTQAYQSVGNNQPGGVQQVQGVSMSEQVFQQPRNDQEVQHGVSGNLLNSPVSEDFLFTIGSASPLSPVNNEMSHTVLTHQSQPQEANSGVLEHPTDLFAMDQLLQSIDGSENLATISSEDVQRHFQ